MKHIILILLLTVGLAPAMRGDTIPEGKPELSFPEGTTLDFGRFPDYRIQKGWLPVVNTGSAPLVLTDVFPECGCTIPEWPKDPIAPGDTAQIQIRFDGKGRSIGSFVKAIRLRSNAARRPTTLFVKGNITR